MNAALRFPTSLHEQAAEAVYAFFHPQPCVDTILVTNSLARGQGIPESDLDMNVLVCPETTPEEIARLEELWKQEAARSPALRAYRQSGENAYLHLDVITGAWQAETWDEGGGPDYFEVSIGNAVAYSAPLHEAGPFFRDLRARWLPFYDADLRRQRLSMVRAAAAYDLEKVSFYVGRALYFQAFDRLYKGFQEFLQALFIARRVYPLAYNKWIRMQVEDWLGLPELYHALPPLLSVSSIASAELVEKARAARRLLDAYTGTNQNDRDD